VSCNAIYEDNLWKPASATRRLGQLYPQHWSAEWVRELDCAELRFSYFARHSLLAFTHLSYSGKFCNSYRHHNWRLSRSERATRCWEVPLCILPTSDQFCSRRHRQAKEPDQGRRPDAVVFDSSGAEPTVRMWGRGKAWLYRHSGGKLHRNGTGTSGSLQRSINVASNVL
jgi:hypothetical protein